MTHGPARRARRPRGGEPDHQPRDVRGRRSLARVNDRTVTVGALAAFGARLAEIHGQHEHQRLFAADHQRALLDRFGGHGALLAEVAEAWRSWRSLTARGDELMTDRAELERRVELLRFQVHEIESAALQPDEDATLAVRLRAIQGLETVIRSVGDAVRILQRDGGGLDALRAALGQLEAATTHDDRFAAIAERGRGLVAEATELARDAAALGEQLQVDPQTRSAMEERVGAGLRPEAQVRRIDRGDRCLRRRRRPGSSPGSRTRMRCASSCASRSSAHGSALVASSGRLHDARAGRGRLARHAGERRAAAARPAGRRVWGGGDERRRSGRSAATTSSSASPPTRVSHHGRWRASPRAARRAG